MTRSMIDPAKLLAFEARLNHKPCELLRFWETDACGHHLAVIVYTRGYKDSDPAAYTSIRYAVYDRERRIGGGIIA